MPKAEGMTEPDITINGTPLTFGQCMTLRVAATNFIMTLQEGGAIALGDDEHGRAMTKNYQDRLAEILRLMLKGIPDA